MASANKPITDLPLWPALTLLLCLLPMLRPQDVGMLTDEPTLLRLALDANTAGVWLTHGLAASVGTYSYGPVPGWLMQVILCLIHAPVAIILAKTTFCCILLAIALIWLQRTIPAWRPFLPFLALSPYLWEYQRLTWDNTLCIPFSAMVMAAYLAFLVRPRAWPLAIALISAAALLLTHLMSLPLLAAIALHAVIFRRRDVLRTWRLLLPTLILALLFALPYLSTLLHVHLNSAPQHTLADAILHPILAGRYLSAVGVCQMLNPEWMQPIAERYWPFIWISAFGIPLVWLGLLTAIRHIWHATPQPPIQHSREFCALLLGVFALHLLLFTCMRLGAFTHYYNGIWIAYALLACLGCDTLQRLATPLRWALLAYPLSLAAITLATALRFATAEGTAAAGHGLAMREQMALVRSLAALPSATIVSLSPAPLSDRKRLRKVESSRLCLMVLSELMSLNLPDLRLYEPTAPYFVGNSSSDERTRQRVLCKTP